MTIKRKARLVGAADHSPEPRRYKRGASGAVRPEPKDEYVLDGEVHTYDGTCHRTCSNIR